MATWDQSKFNAAMADYIRASSRTLPQIINTKAYYIARKANWFTGKADPVKIRTALGQFVTVNRMNKKGKMVKAREVVLVKSRQAGRQSVPLAALIVQARRGKGGSKGLYGAQMARAIRELLAARSKSVGFIKSGWIPAIRKLEKVADRRGQPPIDTSAKQVGQPKGDAKAARQQSFNPVAEIVNLANARRDRKQALLRVGSPGLQKAFDDEAQSMRDYVEKKMKPDADKFNRNAA